MKVFIEKTGEEKEMKFSGKASALLKRLGVGGESTIIIQNNRPVTAEETLSDSDEIKLLSVISGG